MATTYRRLEDWIAYAGALPYFQRRLELANRVDPRLSRFIYKYRTVDPDSVESIQRTKDILVHGRLWLSSPMDFNDPFDMSARIVAKGNKADRHTRMSEMARKHGASRNERRQKAKAFAKAPIKKLEEDLSIVYGANLKQMGVFCFAGDPRSILMWSHYASKHTGICIQFERARDFTVLSGVLPVDYCVEYPTVIGYPIFRMTLARLCSENSRIGVTSAKNA